MRSVFGPMVLISMGGLLIADNFVPGFEIGRWWPVALVVIGAGWLLDRFSKRPNR